jgi:hypothetical protein
MTLRSKHRIRILVALIALPLFLFAQEEKKKDDPLENFDGSKAEATELDPEAEKNKEQEDPGSGKISLGELSQDKVDQSKMSEALENELEAGNAKGQAVDELIRESLEKMKPALTASGLELNQPEVFPADI